MTDNTCRQASMHAVLLAALPVAPRPVGGVVGRTRVKSAGTTPAFVDATSRDLISWRPPI